jgi:hypothetical protein
LRLLLSLEKKLQMRIQQELLLEMYQSRKRRLSEVMLSMIPRRMLQNQRRILRMAWEEPLWVCLSSLMQRARRQSLLVEEARADVPYCFQRA